jgi:hypothetical protein
MIVDPSQPFDDTRDARQRPHVGGEPVRTGARAQRVVHALQIGGGQLRLPSRPPCAAQPGLPTMLILAEKLTTFSPKS